MLRDGKTSRPRVLQRVGEEVWFPAATLSPCVSEPANVGPGQRRARSHQ